MPEFRTVSEVRRAITEFMPTVLAIEGFRVQLDAAVTIDKEVPEILHRRLISALFHQHSGRIDELEQKLRPLEKHVAELEDELKKLRIKKSVKRNYKRQRNKRSVDDE
jgi:hypothetical protein